MRGTVPQRPIEIWCPVHQEWHAVKTIESAIRRVRRHRLLRPEKVR